MPSLKSVFSQHFCSTDLFTQRLFYEVEIDWGAVTHGPRVVPVGDRQTDVGTQHLCHGTAVLDLHVLDLHGIMDEYVCVWRARRERSRYVLDLMLVTRAQFGHKK